MKARRIAPVAALSLVGILLGSCATIARISETAFLISPQQEDRLGEQLAVEIEKKYPIYKGDGKATAYLQRLGAELVYSAPPCEQRFEFKWVDSDDVNAFAIPGGYCYVNVGLLREAEDEAELAGVVAHEIGHVTERHGAKALSRSRFYGFLGALALGEDANALAELAVDIVGSGILLKHSRSAELEADKVSIQTLNRAGINPNGIVWFLQKLKNTRRSRASEYFSTHPVTEDRIAIGKALIRDLGSPDPNWRVNSSEFRSLKKRYPPKSEAAAD